MGTTISELINNCSPTRFVASSENVAFPEDHTAKEYTNQECIYFKNDLLRKVVVHTDQYICSF